MLCNRIYHSTNKLQAHGYCIIIAIVIAMIFRYFIGTPTIVKQISMEPTLKQNQRLWLNRWGRTTKTLPKRGEIITFEEPSKTTLSASEIDPNNPIAKYDEQNWLGWFVHNFLEIGKRSYIKRVIALPGEYVEIKDGAVYIDGEKLEEDYLQDGVVTDMQNGMNQGYFTGFTVPENCVFALGDNRTQSTDCREFGCIPLEKIEGKVEFRFWPITKFGGVD